MTPACPLARPCDQSISIEQLLAIASHSRWGELADVFSRGRPPSPRSGFTQARYLMSYAGNLPFGPRAIDRLVGRLLRRWWQGHRFYEEGSEGISNTTASFRWFWRLAFPWYPVEPGQRGDEPVQT